MLLHKAGATATSSRFLERQNVGQMDYSPSQPIIVRRLHEHYATQNLGRVYSS
jgi:hypothetical protein